MKLVRQFETHSEAETVRVGDKLAGWLPPDAIVSLVGDLGAGKTTLVKGIAEGRKVAHRDGVSSPTFTLIQEYGEPVGIHHIDLYRLESSGEAERLGLEEIYDSPGLVLIEWSDRFPNLLPRQRYEIRIAVTEGDSRSIEVYSSE